MRSSNWTPRGKITEEFWQRQPAEWRAEEAGTRGVVQPKPKSPRPLFSLAPFYQLFTRGCEHDGVLIAFAWAADAVVPDYHTAIVDAGKLGPFSIGRSQ